MTWGAETLNQAQRVLRSPWAIAMGAVVLAGPLFAILELLGRGMVDIRADRDPLVVAKEATLHMWAISSYFSSFVLVGAAIGGVVDGPGRITARVAGTTLAFGAVVALVWFVLATLVTGAIVGPIAIVPPAFILGIFALGAAGWLALHAFLASRWPRFAGALLLVAFTASLAYVQLAIGYLGGPFEPASTSALFLFSFASPTHVATALQQTLLPYPFDPQRDAMLDAFPGLYSPWLFLLGALAWVAIPLALARAREVRTVDAAEGA